MAEMIWKSDIDVELIDSMGSDERVAQAAMVSNKGMRVVQAAPGKMEGLINSLAECRHGTPFECGAVTVRVHAPIKVWREWHRHRVGFCLAGDVEVWNESVGPKGDRRLNRRPIAEVWRNWHQGVPDSLGRVRLLASCRNLPLRVLNEGSKFFEIGRMNDIIQSGVKEVLGVSLADGKSLKCSKDHQILTADGWAKAGDLSGGDMIAVVGKRSAYEHRQIPPSLRRGIGVWTSMQRKTLIREVDHCHVCQNTFARDDLILDHVVPVVLDLQKALDPSNLLPICGACEKVKTAGEQKHARRCNVAGSKCVRLKEKPFAVGEEMTYDISMDGPHHNFVANGVVVHNSYNEESGRYKQLEPVFWIPPRERPMIRPEGFKSMRPAFDFATEEEYKATVADLKEGYTNSYAIYERMLERQVDRGLARDVLGVGIFSACYVTCNPRSLMHFLELRTNEPTAKRPSKPLWEIDSAARKLEVIFAEIWPVTHAAWVKHGRSAP
jgi:thymidylate synthase (FAD)